MEITSGGTGGPEPDPTLHAIGLDVHATLSGAPSPEEMANAFVRSGWSARKAASDEYEVAHRWAELRLFVHDGVSMFSGTVLSDHVDDLLRVLDALGISHRGELYDRGGDLARTFGSRP